MKTPFLRTFVPVFFSVILAHAALLLAGVIPGAISGAGIVYGSLFFIFAIGLLIILPGFRKGPENFAMRFMALTTAQMLLMLTLVVIFVFAKVPDGKYLGFTSIILFVILLAVQSVLFIREVNRKK